jgi:hypothetical protein
MAYTYAPIARTCSGVKLPPPCGGIGAGKSTFAVLLAERGAQVIDADLLGRDAVRPGRPAWHSIVDQFQAYLRELRTSDLRGSAGVARLREELLRRVRAAVEPVPVNDVLFREVLIQ